MTARVRAPKLAPALALDFPDVPDDAPPVTPRPRQPKVWTRQESPPRVAGRLCECGECQASAARLVAVGAGEFAAGSLPALLGRRP